MYITYEITRINKFCSLYTPYVCYLNKLYVYGYKICPKVHPKEVLKCFIVHDRSTLMKASATKPEIWLGGAVWYFCLKSSTNVKTISV